MYLCFPRENTFYIKSTFSCFLKPIQHVNSLWPNMVSQDLVNIGSDNGLVPSGTKPLPEPMLTNHQWGFVAFILSEVNFTVNRADSRLAPSQWETSLQSNLVSHWLGANLELVLGNVQDTSAWGDSPPEANERHHYKVTWSLIGWAQT